ncbi:MAG TPA: hypothetical protein VFZ70_01240 [Euzebyales bacterium]
MPESISARHVDTDRLRMHCLVRGRDDAAPVVLVHGNLATGLFFDDLMDRGPDDLLLVAPDMRGFGATQRAPIDATRGAARLGRRRPCAGPRPRDRAAAPPDRMVDGRSRDHAVRDRPPR